MELLLKQVIISSFLLFAGCGTAGTVPTTFGFGDPSDNAISCVDDRIRCIKRCEVFKDGKMLGFTETPLKPELCEIQQPEKT